MGIRPNVSSTSDITSGFQSASATPTHPHALHQNIYQPHGTHANPTTNGGYDRNGYNAMTHHMNRFDLTQLGQGLPAQHLSQPLQTVQPARLLLVVPNQLPGQKLMALHTWPLHNGY